MQQPTAPDEGSQRRLRILVKGRVQGVYFRAEARGLAAALGLRGLVRNLPDGRVEIVAEGDHEALGRLVRWARTGPPGARVDDLQVTVEAPTGRFAGFIISQ